MYIYILFLFFGCNYKNKQKYKFNGYLKKTALAATKKILFVLYVKYTKKYTILRTRYTVRSFIFIIKKKLFQSKNWQTIVIKNEVIFF